MITTLCSEENEDQWRIGRSGRGDDKRGKEVRINTLCISIKNQITDWLIYWLVSWVLRSIISLLWWSQHKQHTHVHVYIPTWLVVLSVDRLFDSCKYNGNYPKLPKLWLKKWLIDSTKQSYDQSNKQILSHWSPNNESIEAHSCSIKASQHQ